MTIFRRNSNRPLVNNQGAVAQSQNVIKVSAGYGRLYITGPAHHRAKRLAGATTNERRKAVELSLTLDTLRALRKEMGVSAEQFARFCTPEVLAWARAAGQMEKTVKDLHTKIEAGFRIELPWADARTGRPAPEPRSKAALREVELENGKWIYKYRAPFEHQKVMATVACTIDGCAFLAEMGTAKTRAAIEAIQYLLQTNQLDVVLVACPKGVIKTWRDQIDVFAPALPYKVLEGTVAQRREFIKDWKPTPLAPRVLITNFDVLYQLEDAVTRLFSRVRGGFTPDEMHRLKNPNAKVSKAAMNIATKCKWRCGMTGTPILQGIQDIWSQWYVVDMGITFGSNYVQYKREYINENQWTMKMEPKEGALDKVGNKMRLRGLRYTKAECLDLPPKIYEVVQVEMTREQSMAYREMEAELIARLTATVVNDEEQEETYATAANQLAAILRLTQITSGFVPDEDGRFHRFRPNPKLDECEEIVRDQIGTQQILVWARYTEDIASICERLRDLDPVVVAGEQALPKIRERGIEVPDRSTAEDLFQSSQRRLLVANPAAGGVGLNFWKASLAIYYSQGYSLEHRSQSEDRCHRAGSEIHDSVTYIDLVAANSIDLAVRDALIQKKTVAEVVVDLRRALGVQ